MRQLESNQLWNDALEKLLASWAVRQFVVSWNKTSNISMSFPSIKTTNENNSKFKVCCNKVWLVGEMHYSIWCYRPNRADDGITRKLAKTWPTFNWSTQQVNYTLNICKSNTIYLAHFQFRFEFQGNCAQLHWHWNWFSDFLPCTRCHWLRVLFDMVAFQLINVFVSNYSFWPL